MYLQLPASGIWCPSDIEKETVTEIAFGDLDEYGEPQGKVWSYNGSLVGILSGSTIYLLFPLSSYEGVELSSYAAFDGFTNLKSIRGVKYLKGLNIDTDKDMLAISRTYLVSIADAIRLNLGTEDTYKPSEMAAAVGVCHAKHYVTVMPGSGETSLSFHVPFAPDLLMVVGFDPTVMTGTDQILLFVYDIAAFGLMGGYMLTCRKQNVYSLAMTTVSALEKYTRAEDGTVTLSNIKGNATHPVAAFAENAQYSVTAVKYTDKTDKERITEMVEELTGSGSLTMNRAKVNAAFTDEEWSALIATKPDWTFAFIG